MALAARAWSGAKRTGGGSRCRSGEHQGGNYAAAGDAAPGSLRPSPSVGGIPVFADELTDFFLPKKTRQINMPLSTFNNLFFLPFSVTPNFSGLVFFTSS